MIRNSFLLLLSILFIYSCNKGNAEPLKSDAKKLHPVDSCIGTYKGNVEYSYYRSFYDSAHVYHSHDSISNYLATITINKMDSSHFIVVVPDEFVFDKDTSYMFLYNPGNYYYKTKFSYGSTDDGFRLSYIAPDSIEIYMWSNNWPTDPSRNDHTRRFKGKKQ